MFQFLKDRQKKRAELVRSERTACILKNAKLHAHRFLHTPHSGSYRSLFTKSGIEYSHSREYTFGDDIRHIDWNVSARMEHPYVKSFVEERDRLLWMVCDISPSMNIGAPRSLRSLAAELGASLLLLAQAHHDKTGGLVFSNTVHNVMKAGKTIDMPSVFVSHILDDEPQKKQQKVRKTAAQENTIKNIRNSSASNLHDALLYTKSVLPHRSLVVIVSDFLTEKFDESIAIISHAHEVLLVRLMYDARAMLPRSGSIAVKDCEDFSHAVYSFKKLHAELSSSGNYQDVQFEKLWNALERKNNVRTITMLSTDSVMSVLDAFFRRFSYKRSRAIRALDNLTAQK